ncbi:MAG: rRNA maturation RNase YbeY, partial [Waterburya sp.]
VQNCEISLRLTGDRQIQELNQQYRSLDKPTDVLAFAATESAITLPTDFTEPLYLGDIVISLDTAAKQATEQKHSLTVELAWLASHGLLHLLGWDHPDELSLEQMLERQSKLIQLLALERND